MDYNDPLFKIKTLRSIQDIDADEWNKLSGNRPFQSHRWYKYGERVMSDCLPTYLLAYKNGELCGRASLWLVRNEPLPEMPNLIRRALAVFLKRAPLLICRSPLAFTGGTVLAEGADEPRVFSAISRAAIHVAKEQGASMLLFDYLSRAEAQNLKESFRIAEMPYPGTTMENRWNSFEEYLALGGRKNRKNYNRSMREMETLGICALRRAKAERMDEILSLILNVEQAYGSPPNPWARAMLEQMEMVNGTLVAAERDGSLVGCGLLLEDNGALTACLLGHTRELPFVYFMINYESLKAALERGVRRLRWGSGAYEIKQRFGFSMEDNSFIAVKALHPLLKILINRLI